MIHAPAVGSNGYSIWAMRDVLAAVGAFKTRRGVMSEDNWFEELRVASEAMALAFDDVRSDGDYLKAMCCGQDVKYFSGILGTDMVRCEVCGSEIRNVLSPHVSPILLDEHCTHMPTEEFCRRVGARCWWVKKLSVKPTGV